ncbi:MAG: four helix bundle protein [bacterium]|nr:four helix bundle protein [bacterium]
MTNEADRPDIQKRSFAFAVRVVRLVRVLPSDTGGRTIARQLARSGMSVGANVEEAQGSHSRADFARRMNIARAEAREALYWLRLIAESELLPPERLKEMITEANEIVSILTSIVKTTRKNK